MGLSVPRRQGRALGMTAALGVALLATACTAGSTSPPASPAPPTTAPAASSAPAAATTPASPSFVTPGAATASCASSGLTVKVNTAQAGGAAGSVYVPIDFTNTTGRTCTLFGYPGVSFVTSPSGSELGRAATRTPAATLVTLAPGGVAHAILRVAEAGNFSASACVPVTAHWLRIYPPNQFTAIYARYSTQVCSARLPHPLGSQLTVYVVRPGPGKAGQAP